MTKSKGTIAFDEIGLGSVLKHHLLAVPPNQREYSWGEEQVDKLFQDYARAINEEGPYFLGTIVTIPGNDGVLEVVDGQQRLATTAILLAAIRDLLQSLGEDILVESIENEFLTGIDRKNRGRVARLTLNVDDAEYFNQLIQPGQPSQSATRDSHELLLGAMERAAEFVEGLVAQLSKSDRGDELERWVSFVEDRALVILLRVPDGADAYKMFETLNDRGLRTSQADLIKNYLFGRSGDRLPEVQTKWSYMRGALEAIDEEDITINFIRHALIVLNGPTREAEVYETVQDIARSKPKAAKFASTLEELANTYVATHNPESEFWNGYPTSARQAGKVFNLFNIRPLRALILAVAAKFGKKRAADSFEFLVSLGVRLLLASSTRSGSVETPLAEAAQEVYAGEISTVKQLKKRLNGITPSDRQFRSAFEIAKVSNSKQARYYLRSLESVANRDNAPWFVPVDDPDVINLEHVLPRKPEGNWPSFSEDDHRAKATRIGNLVLMKYTDNSAANSDSFADKKTIYAEASYELTKKVGEAEEWEPSSIDDRQAELADLAVKAWPI
jgi:Protein of unknown function DUF262/Protein of unknown function (DUF1524)